MMLEDPYEHPEPGVFYVTESIVGPGVVDEYEYDIACRCTDSRKCSNDLQRVNERESGCCSCTEALNLNYINGRLVEQKLLGFGGVFECNDRCLCGSECPNSQVRRGPCSNLAIKKTSDKGYGVFSMSFIPKGCFICEYAGEVIGREEARTRMTRNGGGKYILTLAETSQSGMTETTVIDATTYGNIGRYVNHSCDPNCVLVPVRYRSPIPKVCLFAKRDIPSEEEITYHYSVGNVGLSLTPCLCSADNCSLFLPNSSVE